MVLCLHVLLTTLITASVNIEIIFQYFNLQIAGMLKKKGVDTCNTELELQYIFALCLRSPNII